MPGFSSSSPHCSRSSLVFCSQAVSRPVLLCTNCCFCCIVASVTVAPRRRKPMTLYPERRCPMPRCMCGLCQPSDELVGITTLDVPTIVEAARDSTTKRRHNGEGIRARGYEGSMYAYRLSPELVSSIREMGLERCNSEIMCYLVENTLGSGFVARVIPVRRGIRLARSFDLLVGLR